MMMMDLILQQQRRGLLSHLYRSCRRPQRPVVALHGSEQQCQQQQQQQQQVKQEQIAISSVSHSFAAGDETSRWKYEEFPFFLSLVQLSSRSQPCFLMERSNKNTAVTATETEEWKQIPPRLHSGSSNHFSPSNYSCLLSIRQQNYYLQQQRHYHSRQQQLLIVRHGSNFRSEESIKHYRQRQRREKEREKIQHQQQESPVVDLSSSSSPSSSDALKEKTKTVLEGIKLIDDALLERKQRFGIEYFDILAADKEERDLNDHVTATKRELEKLEAYKVRLETWITDNCVFREHHHHDDYTTNSVPLQPLPDRDSAKSNNNNQLHTTTLGEPATIDTYDDEDYVTNALNFIPSHDFSASDVNALSTTATRKSDNHQNQQEDETNSEVAQLEYFQAKEIFDQLISDNVNLNRLMIANDDHNNTINTQELCSLFERFILSPSVSALLEQEHEHKGVSITTRYLNAIVQAWRSSWLAAARETQQQQIQTPLQILQWIESLSHQLEASSPPSHLDVRPNAKTYKIILEATIGAARIRNSSSSSPLLRGEGIIVDTIMKQMIQIVVKKINDPSGNNKVSSSFTYNNEDDDNSTAVNYDDDGDYHPSLLDFHEAIKYHIERKNLFAAERLVELQIALFDSSILKMNDDPRRWDPSTAFVRVLKEWVRKDWWDTGIQDDSRDSRKWTPKERSDQALAFLERIWSYSVQRLELQKKARDDSSLSSDDGGGDQKQLPFVPTRDHCWVCLRSLETTNIEKLGYSNGIKAERLLSQMIEMADRIDRHCLMLQKNDDLAAQSVSSQKKKNDIRPSFKIVCHVIKIWAKANKRDSAVRSHQLLRLIEDSTGGKWSDDFPIDNSDYADAYACVIRAYSCEKKSNVDGDPPKKCTELYNQVKSKISAKDFPRDATMSIYRSLIEVWLRSDRTDAAEQAHGVFEKMRSGELLPVAPTDPEIYVVFARSLALFGYADKTQDIFEYFIQDYTQMDISPPQEALRNLFACVLAAFYQSIDGMSGNGKQMDRSSALSQTLAFVDYAEQNSDALKGAVESDRTFVAVLLDMMRGTTDISAARRGLEYLRRLERRYSETGDDRFKPTPDVYKRAILIWPNISSEDQVLNDEVFACAQTVFDKMIQLADEGDKNFRPDLETHEVILPLLRKSSVSNKDTRLLELCRKINDMSG